MTRPILPSFRARATTSVLLRSGGIASMLLALGAAAPAVAQDPAPAQGAAATDEPLRAVFIDVSGKVQWRAGEKDQWRDAKVDDVVDAGVEVRTGTRSHAALRMKNATVLVDAGTRFQIPTMVKDGDTLRTTAAVTHGRADFKVDKVGLSNDFKVVTPSTTLAVRGTEFAIATGPLKQVEVVGARRNAINAIELKYALTSTTVQLSGSASSSSSVNHPAHAAVVAAAPPTSAAAGVPSTSQGETVRNAAAGETPAASGSAAQAVSGNKATARSEKAAGNAGGAASIVRRVQDQVGDAKEKAEQAVAYLLQAEGELDTVLARRDALQALRVLAIARRNEARAALQAHEAVLPGALELGASADAAIESFDAGRNAIDANFEEFDAQLANANDALDAIRIILDATATATATATGTEAVRWTAAARSPPSARASVAGTSRTTNCRCSSRRCAARCSRWTTRSRRRKARATRSRSTGRRCCRSSRRSGPASVPRRSWPSGPTTPPSRSSADTCSRVATPPRSRKRRSRRSRTSGR